MILRRDVATNYAQFTAIVHSHFFSLSLCVHSMYLHCLLVVQCTCHVYVMCWAMRLSLSVCCVLPPASIGIFIVELTHSTHSHSALQQQCECLTTNCMRSTAHSTTFEFDLKLSVSNLQRTSRHPMSDRTYILAWISFFSYIFVSFCYKKFRCFFANVQPTFVWVLLVPFFVALLGFGFSCSS